MSLIARKMDLLTRQVAREALRCCQQQRLPILQAATSALHTSASNHMAYEKPTGPRKWPIYNRKIYPPQLPGEDQRPAVIFSTFF